MPNVRIDIKPEDFQELLSIDPMSKLSGLAVEQLKNIALSRMLLEAQTHNGVNGDVGATEEHIYGVVEEGQ